MKVGQRFIQPVSKPQINNTVAFRIAPNAKDQAFHRDDNVHHTQVTRSYALIES